ncbi:VOC family protein [Rhizobium mongolense]|uniref:Catechol 2,3-dioxygenase-like lactoylglutathione lyase family enzyme n=2 Tax=Rhizobium mongolense TaxID=57676 RepID=A0ABR6IS23_9HYPH|nr:VOC family protein [Rhizobium mongolense]MBB4230590.1 catechol 2,3-dioxygenase-like lactoylglutathione lyase family enzyme [Rhizobium mongolense]TVZ65342.1 catechol 2,3-dioxygenase-like lactoylglutathione lyase family enzyme [Rhizobium mongolense USDA 1844]
MNAPTRIPVTNLQHHVFYVTDLERSKAFYIKLFDLQFSALNHPDSSAAMRLSQQEMHFFSFGFYHHDICLVKHHKLKMDNNSMLHFTLAVKDAEAIDDVKRRAREMGLPIREGRMLASARPASSAFCLRDPDKHWIEIIEEPSR